MSELADKFMLQLIETPDGDWIQPAAVGAIRWASDTNDETKQEQFVARVYSTSGELFFGMIFEEEDDAIAYVEELAGSVNKAIDPLKLVDL